MTTYFVGSGLDAFIASPSGCTDDGNSVVTNYGFAEAYVVDPARGAVGVDRLWTHGEITTSAGLSADKGAVPYAWFNAAGEQVVRFISVGGWSMALQFWDGTQWVQPGDPAATSNGTHDFLVVVHPTEGRLAWFRDGIQCSDVRGIDTSAIGDLARLRVAQLQYQYGPTNHMSVILASYSTLGHSVTRRRPTGAGAHADWSGTYSDVDDSGIDDSDAISTTTAGAISTFTAPPVDPLATGNVVKCVAVAARIRSDGDGAPAHAAAVLTIDGSDHLAPFALPIGAGFAGAVACFDQDPATGAAWGNLSHVGADFGVKALA